MPLRLDNARALPTCPPQSNSRRRRPSSRDSRLTPRLHRCQKPSSQNASRPGRHQIGRVGEIILEYWATSNRYTRARSSESACTALDFGHGICGIPGRTLAQRATRSEIRLIGEQRNGRNWPRVDHFRRGRSGPLRPLIQTSTCSAIASASSTSIPRYRTVLSSFVWPSGHDS